MNDFTKYGVRHALDGLNDAMSEDTAYVEVGESLTNQAEKEDADINTIVRRFGLTGSMPQEPRVPQFGDFTGVTDYQTALNAVRSASEGFMELPAELRARFDNDPQRYLEFCTAEKDGKLINLDEMRKLGLAEALVPEQNPVRVEVVNAPEVPAKE